MALYMDANSLPEVELPSILPEQVEYFTPQVNAPVVEGEEPEDEYNALERGFYSGIQQTQALGYGGIGAAADVAERYVDWAPFQDLMGEIRQWGYEGYKRNQDEALQYGELTNFEDAFDTPENFFTYVAETIGGLAPTMAVSLASGGIGGAIAGRLASTAGKKALKTEIASLMAGGMAEQTATQQAMRSVIQSEARKAVAQGAMAGTMASSAVMETGSNWGEDVEAHGIEGTSPGQDIMFGTLSGLTELVGGEGMLIRNILRKPASEATEAVVERTLGKVLTEHAIKDPLGEGLQEAAQEFLSIANANIQDGRELITPDDAMRLVEAGFGGMIGGVGFGGLGAAYDAKGIYAERKAKKEAQRKLTLAEAEEKQKAADEVSVVAAEQNIQKATESANLAIIPLTTRMAEVQAGVAQARSTGDSQTEAAGTAEIIDIAAQIAKHKEAAKSEIKKIRKDAESIKTANSKDVLAAANREIEYMTDPFKRKMADLNEVVKLNRQQQAVVEKGLASTTQAVTQHSAKSAAKIKVYNNKIAELRRMQGNTRSHLANPTADKAQIKAELSSIDDSISTIEKARAQVVKKAKAVRRAGDTVADAYTNFGTTEEYKIPESWMELETLLDDESVVDADFTSDTHQLDAYDKHMKAVESELSKSDRAAKRERTLERRGRERRRDIGEVQRGMDEAQLSEQRRRTVRERVDAERVGRMQNRREAMSLQPMRTREERRMARRMRTQEFAEQERLRAIREAGEAQAMAIPERLTFAERKEIARTQEEREALAREAREARTARRKAKVREAAYEVTAQQKRVTGISQAERVAEQQRSVMSRSDKKEAEALQKLKEAQIASEAALKEAERAEINLRRKQAVKQAEYDTKAEQNRLRGIEDAARIARDQKDKLTRIERKELNAREALEDARSALIDALKNAKMDLRTIRRKALVRRADEDVQTRQKRMRGIEQAEQLQRDVETFSDRQRKRKEAAESAIATSKKREVQQAKRVGLLRKAEEVSKQRVYDVQAIGKREVGIAQAREVRRKQVLDKPFTDNPYERTSMAIRNTLERLPVLKPITQVVEDANDSRVPAHVRKAATERRLSGAFDPATGKIFIFANRIKSNKQAIRVLIHEGVGHFGLTQIMNEEERKAFLDAVTTGNIKDPKFQKIVKQYADLSSLEQAEEYFASIAEQARVSDIKEATDKNRATVWKRLKGVVKKFVTRVGLGATKKEVNDVITASIHFLANKENIGKTKKITGPQEILRVRGSRPYLGWKANLRRTSREARKAWREYKTNVDTQGKLRKINIADKIIMGLQDKELRIKQVQDYISDKIGAALPVAQNVYITMENFVNRNANSIREFRDEYVFGKDGVASLIDKATTESRDKEAVLKSADELAIAMHAIERNKAVRQKYKGSLRPQEAAGMTDKEASAIIAKYAGDGDILAIVNKVQEIGRLQLKTMERANLIDKKLAETLRKTYQYYVPLKGLDETIERFDPDYRMKPTGTSFSATRKPVTVAKGRKSIAESPVAHMINQMEGTLTMIEKNNVGRSLLELVKNNPDESLWVMDKGRGDLSQYKTIARRDKNGEVSLHFAVKAMPLEGQQGVVTVIDTDGKPVQIQMMDEQFYKAIIGTNVFQTGDLQKFLGGMGFLNRSMAMANTVLSPAFVAVNIVRDSINTAFMMPSVKAQLKEYGVNMEGLTQRVFKDVRESFKALRSDLRNTEAASPEFNELLKAYKENGGYTEYLDIRNMEQMQRKLGKELLSEKDGFVGASTAKLKNLYEFMQDYSSIFENMYRFSLFKNATSELILSGMDKQDAHKLAANMALNLNVNFTKRGTLAPMFSPLFMFANASLQSTARMAKTMGTWDKDKPWHKQEMVRYSAALMTAPIVLGMMGRATGGDDEDGVPFYDKVPNYVRNNNFVFMLPGGKYLKIPVPYGLNILTTMGNMMFDTQNEANPTSVGKAAFEVTMASFNNFNPLGGAEEGFAMFVPTVFRPMVQVQTNTNFLGNPIRPESSFITKAELPDSQKYWSSTNEFLKTIAVSMNRMTGGSEATSGLIDVSPATMQHLFASYTGSLGQLVANLGKLVTKGTDIETREFPALRRFVGNADSYPANASIFYDLRGQIQQDMAVYEQVKGDTSLSPRDRRERLLRLRKSAIMNATLSATDKRLKAIRKQERALASSNLSGAALSNRLEKLRDHKERVMMRLIHASKLRKYKQ